MAVVKRKSEVGMPASQLRTRSKRHSFARRIVLGLKKPAGTTLSPARWVSITRQIQAQLEESLRTQVEVLEYPNEVVAREARTLPVADLKPDEVIRRKLVKMSQSNLYRAADDGRFYSITPNGRRNGRLFPEWQFIDPVPTVLPEVLHLLRQHAALERHAFLVSAMDDLNELSPAEVLAGVPFETRSVIEDAQRRLLSSPTTARLSEVKRALHQPAGREVVG